MIKRFLIPEFQFSVYVFVFLFICCIRSMRVVGLILAGAGILPIIMGAMFAVFYCGHKKGKYPGRKTEIKNDVVS